MLERRVMGRYADREFSLEFYPPHTEKGQRSFARTLGKLEALGPAYVSVTFGAGGSSRERTFETVDWITENSKVTAVPHLSCIGAQGARIEGILERYRDAGVKRIVALRGDIPEDGDAFVEGGFRHANELVAFVRDFGGFEIAVACYPEFHPESPSPASDLEFFKQKVDAGADLAITQYFFDNGAYFRFVDEARRMGVEVPIVAGLMPIANWAQIVRFSQKCGADLPRWIARRMEAFDDPRDQRKLGAELATRQAEALLEGGAPGIHFYTLNRAEPTRTVWENLGL